jgi:methylenetetrahydrofolate dehydrogenase (NADP+)/methenyltetrahydrofolate cyclohydrolase
MQLLDYYKINVRGLNATVIGRSHLVGYPLSVLLMLRNATVTICHK